MAVKQEVVLEFNADTSDVQKSLSGLDKDFDKVGKSANDAAEEVEGLAEATEDAAKNTEDLGKESKKAGSDMKTAGKTGAAGFKLVGTAIKATGIGLLVGLVAKLVQKFTENKAVAEALEIAFAGIGAVINVIVDAAAPLGDLLIDIFTNPQQVITDLKDKLTDLFGSPEEALLNFANLLKENIINRFEGLFKLIPRLASAIGKLFEGDFSGAAKTAADAVGQVVLGVEDVTDKVVEAASAASEFAAPFVNSAKEAIDASTLLTKKQQALRDAQRELNVATAEGAAEVEELKRQSDDQRLSTEERIEAATRAAEINQRFADENVAISQQRAQLLREEIALQGETAERLDELASAEIEAANAAQASSTIQTELQNKLFALNQEAIAQQEEKIALEEEARLALEETLAEEARLKDEAAKADKDRRDKERDEELAIAEEIKAAKIGIARSSLDAIAAINEAFTGESEQEQKKGFERSKKIQAAQTLISTYESAVQAFKSLAGIPVVGPALGTAAAAAATATGLATVKKINQQQFNGGSESAGPSYSGADVSASVAEVQQTPQAPSLDLGFLGEGAQSQVIETYVISEQVTSAQQANKKIQDQATL
jgi:DNA repair exonuclease SbcCD ATPase subunit